MGVRMVKISTCDVCGSESGVSRWQIVSLHPSRSVSSLDLCDKHAKVLKEYRSHVPEGPGGRPHKRVVTTEAQVRASRAKKKPATRK